MRAVEEIDTICDANVRFAMTIPAEPPNIWATTIWPAVRTSRRPLATSATVTAGLNWAPLNGRNITIATASPAPTITPWMNSWVAAGAPSCSTAQPLPTITARRNPVPMASASNVRRSTMGGAYEAKVNGK